MSEYTNQLPAFLQLFEQNMEEAAEQFNLHYSEWLQDWPANGLQFDQKHPDCNLNAIEVCARHSGVEAFQAIKRELPDAISYVDDEGRSILQLVVKWNVGHVALVDYILQNGGMSLIDQPSPDGKTPLWTAINDAQIHVTKLLIYRGASLTPPTDGKFSPLKALKKSMYVARFLRPLRHWLVEMKEKIERFPSETTPPKKKQKLVEMKPALPVGEDLVRHIVSLLSLKECATLQCVSRSFQKDYRYLRLCFRAGKDFVQAAPSMKMYANIQLSAEEFSILHGGKDCYDEAPVWYDTTTEMQLVFGGALRLRVPNEN
ncbi:expressed unknown protein [Seminavis robusta]|uniref:Uncharacterized protein n=1 Tax=Seminavis robusta TaxID=568900 RepID=A0A9N8DZS4_9STRA|nr:expressed unknown protein [Seminavis robusta]|eukprot:Sro508_g156840.1 n/a (316) ;mRNA; r:45231-46359